MKSILPCALLAFASLLMNTRAHAAETDPKLGLQSWTCRRMSFEQVVEFASTHQIKYVQFFKEHLDPTASLEETKRKKALLDKNGLVAYTMGVCATSLDKEANRKLFEFARAMGMKFIVVEPKNMAEWDNLEELVKEYDIKLAIHNHGTGTVYGDPATVKKVLAARDPRIGVCLDVGWVTSAGFDAAQVFRDYGDRVFDIHFKDKRPERAETSTVWFDTETGRGSANYDGLFAEIKRTGWSGVLAIEAEGEVFSRNPHPPVAAAVDFFRARFP